MTNKLPKPLPVSECVKMKDRLQQQLEKRYKGLSDVERRAQRIKDIQAHPVLGPLYEELTAQARKKKGQQGRAA